MVCLEGESDSGGRTRCLGIPNLRVPVGNSSEDGPCDSAKVVLRQVAALLSEVQG